MPATKHGLDPQVEITPAEIEKLLARPRDFGYFGGDKDTMFVTWTLGPVIRHRDSGLVDKSNAAVLIAHLESDPTLADDWRITECSHWAVGHVDHLSYRVKDDDGKPSRVARVIRAFYDALEIYPIADDDHHSTMTWEASCDWVDQEGPCVARKLGYTLPDDWFGKVLNWWDEHRSSAMEDIDDNGASPSDDDFRAAFDGCSFVKEED